MRAGDLVIYLPDPDLYGVGMIREITANGMIVVDFSDEPRPAIFSAHELELHTVHAATLVQEPADR